MNIAPRRYSDDLGVEIVDFVFLFNFLIFTRLMTWFYVFLVFFSFGFKFTHKHHHKLV